MSKSVDFFAFFGVDLPPNLRKRQNLRTIKNDLRFHHSRKVGFQLVQKKAKFGLVRPKVCLSREVGTLSNKTTNDK